MSLPNDSNRSKSSAWVLSTTKSKQRASNSTSSVRRIADWHRSTSCNPCEPDELKIVSCMHTLLSAGIVEMSTFWTFAWYTLATSRSFRPHSSVLVAKKMQDAATSYDWSVLPHEKYSRKLKHLTVEIFHRITHVESMEPGSSGAHRRSGPVCGISTKKGNKEQGANRANEEPRRKRNSTPLALSYISFSREPLVGVAVKALGEKIHCENASVAISGLPRTSSRGESHAA